MIQKPMAECPYCGSKIPVGTHVCPFCDAHLRPLEVGHAEEAEALEEEVTKEVPAEKPAEEQPKPEEPVAEEPVPETPAEEPAEEQPAAKEPEKEVKKVFPEETPVKPAKKCKKTLVRVLCLLLAAALIGAGVWYFTKYNSPESKFARALKAAEEKTPYTEALADYEAALELGVDPGAVYNSLYKAITKDADALENYDEVKNVCSSGIASMAGYLSTYPSETGEKDLLELHKYWINAATGSAKHNEALSVADSAISILPESYKGDLAEIIRGIYEDYCDKALANNDYKASMNALANAERKYADLGIYEGLTDKYAVRICETALKSGASEFEEFFNATDYMNGNELLDHEWALTVAAAVKAYKISAPVTVDLGSGKMAGVYMIDNIAHFYYGEGKSGKREGQGAWYSRYTGTDEYKYYSAFGAWANDLPNGEFSDYDSYKAKTGSPVLLIQKGTATDGLFDGTLGLTFNGTDYSVTLDHGKASPTTLDQDGVTYYVYADNGNAMYVSQKSDLVFGIQGAGK
ncbi:MAG: hypothetical protein IIZ48_00845 [Erysipelotrichales bacterium]|nr:hypothetical protein [Erysipelotrichales bacterium]